ncbi:MAG: hypothetical protein IJ667_00730 [Synergistaceae bacterium]|nr:hypothetical protein [Synergistaceae bacterium]
MQVASMFGAGYLEPVSRIGAVNSISGNDKAQRTSLYQVNKNNQAQTQAVNNNSDAASLKRQEQDILAQEQNLKSRLGSGAEVHTVYHYTLGADGKRYITGASVTMKGSEEDLERAGGLSTKEIQVKQDDDLSKVHGSEDERSSSDKSNNNSSSGSNLAGNKDLSESEEKVIQELKDTEREVIAHEAAHQAAAGAFGGGVSYTYTKGPDGKSYITGGEVPIQMRTGSTPEETLRNMQQVQRAASAPADPSGQDRKVAARAAAMAAEARQQISRENANNSNNKDGRSTEIAHGTPILNNTANNSDDKDAPVKNGVASIMASIRELQVQSLVPAA